MHRLVCTGYRLAPQEVESLLREVSDGQEQVSMGAFLASQVSGGKIGGRM